jgi:predicted patatin/cPLA2 family phospholipase
MIQQQHYNYHLPCSSDKPIPETALVVEGGGQRGIFTAGILDSWLAQDFNPFAVLIGTSAGAQNLSSYLSRQNGYAKRAIMTLSSDRAFYRVKNLFTGRSALDLDWYFNQVNRPEYQLNTQCAQAQLAQREVLFTATKSDDFSATFLEPNESNWLNVLKASSAIPYLYKKGVEIDNAHYLDGGVVEPIPVKKAYQQGAKKIIVLRTVPSHHHAQTPWAHKLKSWLCSTQRCPKVLDMLTTHEMAYNESLDFIHHPPVDTRVVELAPPRELQSHVIGSSIKALESDYQMGYDIGTAFLATQQAAIFR